MLGCHVVDQFLNQHRLAQSRTSEETGLSSLGVGSQQVDHLDAGFENLGRSLKFIERDGVGVNRTVLLHLCGRQLVDGFTQQVEHASQNFLTHRNLDRLSGIENVHVANHTVGGGHGHSTNPVSSEVLLHLKSQLDVALVNLQCIVDRRKVSLGVLGVDGRTDHLNNLANNCIFTHGFDSRLSNRHSSAGILLISSSPPRHRSPPGFPG